ncbi:restriction endonuclease subunit S [Francisella salimarina]|uniref:Restriction endonuclease subunit S n=1 Tax=Francisella salimarina TaxID=2599927 RepID=A0AAJ4NMJ9_9GAMM|nr:restriction endonuclease subunit S [Francisella salimarina]QWU98522.1 restriction endonuclease subunit S [Francisella salimarina]
MQLTKMPKYDAYKDSGVEWLGEIPESWSLLANKYIFKLKKNLVGKKSKDYDLLSLTLKGVIKRDMENPEGKFPAEFDTYQEVKKNDFIFCLFDVEETPRTVGLSLYDGMITGAYTVMSVYNININYLYYFYLNLDSKKRLKPLYKGLRNTIPKDIFFSFKTFVPSTHEQTLIAKFLDQKTAQIDKAIEIKHKQIELLKEQKQIVINNAVTKGLDPNVPMKDSGIEWIGEIPQGWEVKKIKHVTCKIGSGITPSGGGTTYLEEGGVPLLRSQNVHFGRIDLSDVARISEGIHESMKNSQVRNGDVLLNITGGSIGRCHYVETDERLNVNQHVCIVRPKTIETKYLNFILASEIGQGQIWFFQQGGGREGLNFQALKNFFIPCPTTLLKQQQIVAYIEEKTSKIDKAIKLQNNQIDKLKEYKASLINSVVTGKVRVTDEMVNSKGDINE